MRRGTQHAIEVNIGAFARCGARESDVLHQRVPSDLKEKRG